MAVGHLFGCICCMKHTCYKHVPFCPLNGAEVLSSQVGHDLSPNPVHFTISPFGLVLVVTLGMRPHGIGLGNLGGSGNTPNMTSRTTLRNMLTIPIPENKRCFWSLLNRSVSSLHDFFCSLVFLKGCGTQLVNCYVRWKLCLQRLANTEDRNGSKELKDGFPMARSVIFIVVKKHMIMYI